jgi:hypothetical protein
VIGAACKVFAEQCLDRFSSKPVCHRIVGRHQYIPAPGPEEGSDQPANGDGEPVLSSMNDPLWQIPAGELL